MGKLQPWVQLSQAPMPAKLLSLGVSCPYVGKEKNPVSTIDWAKATSARIPVCWPAFW